MGDYMIILNKKRIIFLISVLMISFVTILFNEIVYGLDILDTCYTVILDAGHGLPEEWVSLLH